MAVGRRYYWPELQLNIWILVVLIGSATCLGIFSWLMTVQAQLELGTPWYVVSTSFIDVKTLMGLGHLHRANR